MTAYTSTGDGDWNTDATWGGSGHPTTTSDTAVIAAGHEVTIAAGASVNVGTITLNAGVSAANKSKLILATGGTTLTLGGTLTTNTNSCLNFNGAFVFDTAGFGVVMSGDTELNMLGLVGSRGTFYSSTTSSTMTGPAAPVRANWQYTDVSNLTNPVLGRTHTSAIRLTYKYCTFTAITGDLVFDATGTSSSAEYDIQYCDFLAPADANPVSALAEQPQTVNSTVAAAGVLRQLIGCIFDSQATTKYGIFRLRCGSLVFRENILRNWLVNFELNANHRVVNNLYVVDITSGAGTVWAPGNGNVNSFSGNYVYYNVGDHPFSQSGSESTSFYGNIFDGLDGTIGTNWCLWAVIGASTPTIKNNIQLGKGALVTFTNNGTGGPFLIQQNTLYSNNTQGASNSFGTIFIGEQSATTIITGSLRILNNLQLNFGSSTDADYAISLLSNTTDAIDYCDYNYGYSYVSGVKSPPLNYYHVTITGGTGTHDASIDPGITGYTRSIASYSTLKGGAGTAASAITAFLARTAGYNIHELVNYVFEGFRPSASSMRTAAENGGCIGAANYYDSSRKLTVPATAVTYFNATYPH